MQLALEQAVVVGENGHLLASDGELKWIVVVTREALDALTHSYDVSVELLQKHASTLFQLADDRLTRTEVVHRNRIWLMEEDVEVWLASQAIIDPVPRGVAPTLARRWREHASRR